MKIHAIKNRNVLALLLAALTALLITSKASAVDYLWTGSSNAYWGEASNWTPPGVPNEISNDFVRLPASGFTNIIIADASGAPASYAITNLQVDCTNEAAATILTIPAGSTLNAIYIQVGPTNLTNFAISTLHVEGEGEFRQVAATSRGGAIQIQLGKSLSGPGCLATLDFSKLNSYYVTNSGRVTIGDKQGPGQVANFILATNNTISQQDFTMGEDPVAQRNLLLGPGTNLIGGSIRLANGAPGGYGTIKFQDANGSVVIRPRNLGTTAPASANDFLMAVANANSTASNMTNLFDVRGHSANIIVRDMFIASRNDNNQTNSGRAGIIDNRILFDKGIFACRSLTLGKSGTNSENVNLLSVGGGKFIVTDRPPTAIPFAGIAVYLGGLGNGTINIGGGTLITTNGGIAECPFVSTNDFRGVSTLILNSTNNLDPAVLDLNGWTIGRDITNDVDVVQLMAGTLKNVAQFNDGQDVVKTGPGILALSGTNLYTGGTVANGGTLIVDSNDALSPNTAGLDAAAGVLDISAIASGTYVAASGKYVRGGGTILGSVDSQAGSTVSPGSTYSSPIGNLTVTNSITLAGATLLEINRSNPATNDQITAASINISGTLSVTNLGPKLLAGMTFKLFNGPQTGTFSSADLATTDATGATYTWTNRVPEDGTIQVLTSVGGSDPVNPNPTNIVAQASGGSLDLSWPADHTGWKLQVQTNSNSAGLSASWVDVSNSTLTNHVIIPIDAGNGNVLYRLVLP